MKNFDPVLVFMAIMFSCIMLTICYMSKLERDDKNKRAELIKEAIQNNWTPEQIRVIIEAR